MGLQGDGITLHVSYGRIGVPDRRAEQGYRQTPMTIAGEEAWLYRYEVPAAPVHQRHRVEFRILSRRSPLENIGLAAECVSSERCDTAVMIAKTIQRQ